MITPCCMPKSSRDKARAWQIGGWLALDNLHPGSRWAMSQPVRKRLQRFPVIGLSQYFDPSIGQIARVASNPEAFGLGPRRCTKEHALHPPFDEKSCRNHGASDDSAPTARARSTAVTGPTNFLATDPSGLIKKVVGNPSGVSRPAGGENGSTRAMG